MKSISDGYKIAARRLQVQGTTGTNSKRWTAYIDGIFPSHIVSGEGCHLTDAWGNRYLDFVSGLGTNILGYRHPKVEAQVRQAIAMGGPSFSLPHVLELVVSEKIVEKLPARYRIRFFKTGNETTLAAVRIARSHYAGGDKGEEIVTTEGFHGHGDLWTCSTPPAIGVWDRFFVTNQPDWDRTIQIYEPIELDASENRKKELEHRAKKAAGAPVIFDEIVTGFRVPEFTVAKWWNLDPDIICLGKAIANGYPLAVIAAKEALCEKEFFISSTYSGEVMSLSACLAVCETLTKAMIQDLYDSGTRLLDAFNSLVSCLGFQLKGYGTRAMFPVEHPSAALLMQELCKAGVIIGKAWFYNVSHMEQRVEEPFLGIVADLVEKIRTGSIKLEGRAPLLTFTR